MPPKTLLSSLALPSTDTENPFLSARPLVLVVSPGDEIYRGYCLEQVAAAYDVVLLTGTEPSWEKPFIVDHAVVDLSDPAALLSGGRALAERHDLPVWSPGTSGTSSPPPASPARSVCPRRPLR